RAACAGSEVLDCNGIADDGCEVNWRTDPQNCGSCGHTCAPGGECIDGVCGCPPGRGPCEGGCKDLTTDDEHWGASGYSCFDHQPADVPDPPTNMFYGCAAGQCTTLKCDRSSGFWEDCNGRLDDGCEIDLASDTANCGQCGNECAPGKACFEGTDRITG